MCKICHNYNYTLITITKNALRIDFCFVLFLKQSLSVQSWLALNSPQSPCLSLLHSQITDVCHHAWLRIDSVMVLVIQLYGSLSQSFLHILFSDFSKIFQSFNTIPMASSDHLIFKSFLSESSAMSPSFYKVSDFRARIQSSGTASAW